MAVAAQYERVPWAVFSLELDPNPSPSPMTGPAPFEPTYSETRYAQSLLNLVSSQITVQGQLRPSAPQPAHVVQASTSKPKPPGPRPFLLIKDVAERMYVDLLGEVVKAQLNDSEKAILYVTDYTAHKDLFDYQKDENGPRDGDQYGYLSRSLKNWSGPLGQMTLTITLWEPHASYAREHVKAKDLVQLTNVHIKRGRVAQNLEASIHTDRRFPETLHVKLVHDRTDDRVRNFLQRRSEYLKKHGWGTTEEIPGSKKSKKKPQQQKKQEGKTEEGQRLLKPSSLSSKRRPNENSKSVCPSGCSIANQTQIVQAINPEILPRSLEDILSNESHENTSPDNIKYRLPFQNLCYRSFARVVDFFPPHLEDFSVPLNGESAIFSSSANNEDCGPDDPIRWEWRFCLLLESASPPPGQPKERVKVFVSGHDAEYLLKMDAVE